MSSAPSLSSSLVSCILLARLVLDYIARLVSFIFVARLVYLVERPLVLELYTILVPKEEVFYSN